ncbi:MAG: sigma-54-dependent Fis family transcriptional regulator [Deltaproteobacteria bacterium]|nr:sigma-54-dependent Fis family transcriptional regulator [Deltaproteobacteria bacterium]
MDKRLLIVEDEPSHRLLLADNLTEAGYRVTTAATGQQGLDALVEHLFPVVLLDIRLPDLSGIELLRELRERQPDCCVILMTGQATIEAAVSAMQEGAHDYLSKPFRTELLLLKLERVFQLQQLRAENLALRDEGALSLASASPSFQKLLAACRASAPTDATVLLLGESGVGKERLAEYLHRHSLRSDKPLVRVNCAAIPESLLEGELFGYRKGAYTGAHQDHAGLLEYADGGSLLLDEVGEIPVAMQVKLLRVLQEKRVRRLGSEQEHPVDFRLIVATHRNLEEMVAVGSMREDFYYRLNVVPLQVPPLRERHEDLLPLIGQLITELAGRYRQPAIHLAPESYRLLERYRFPGNIRELRNMLERLQVLCPGETIRPGQLPPEVRERTAGTGSGSELVQAFRTDLSLRQAVQQFEVRFIERVLEEAGGNRSAAARRLGISRKNLWEKLREPPTVTSG